MATRPTLRIGRPGKTALRARRGSHQPAYDNSRLAVESELAMVEGRREDTRTARAELGERVPLAAMMAFPVPDPDRKWRVRHWLPCDGRAIDRDRYHELYAVIQDDFGDGDGTTTFNLPTIADPVSGTRWMIYTGVEEILE